MYSKSATVVATADEEEQTRSLAGTHWEWIGAHSATPMSQQVTWEELDFPSLLLVSNVTFIGINVFICSCV